MIAKLFPIIFFGIVIMLIVILSVLNTTEVNFDYIASTTTRPLSVLMSIAFVLGLVIGSFITKFIQITKTSGGAKK